MYELIQLSDISYYVVSPAKIGIVKLSESEVCLIDSGNDKEAAKKVKKILDREGWTLRAIYNTHSNADHVGGNKYLQEQTACKIYAPGSECAFTKYPYLEPTLLYGGNPPSSLRGKFLMAEPSNVTELSDENLPEGFERIDLPGHFLDMVGFRTPDGIVWLADSLSAVATLDKYGICFVYDVGKYLETLGRVKNLEAKLFVPSHAEVCQDVRELCEYNEAKVIEVADRIAELCDSGIGFDELLARLFCEYNLKMTFEQHALVGSTVRSYLTYLTERERVEAVIEDNKMIWKKK